MTDQEKKAEIVALASDVLRRCEETEQTAEWIRSYALQEIERLRAKWAIRSFKSKGDTHHE